MRKLRNTSEEKPLTPDFSAPFKVWEKKAKAKARKVSQARQIITQNKRINDLCKLVKQLDARLDDLNKRLRFTENAVKMTVSH